MRAIFHGILFIAFLILPFKEIDGNWDEWWTYDGISGPEYWGRLNPEWSLCARGKRQSPVNVDPTRLLFDPYLPGVDIDTEEVNGVLMNTGQSLVFRVDKDNKHRINITGGPLNYRYQFEEFYIHYGVKENVAGSEHKIANYIFPAEIQLYGYNAELYQNMSDALQKVQGTVGVAIMVQIRKKSDANVRSITAPFKDVIYKGSQTAIKHLSLRHILPRTKNFMTYEGSLTYPGCWETTSWIIFNKPIYMTLQELHTLQSLQRGSPEISIGPLGGNARPAQNMVNRTMRTNIDFKKMDNEQDTCNLSMEKKMFYSANTWDDL